MGNVRLKIKREKKAGVPKRDSFAFEVPTVAAGKVAFVLAKAGMEEFEVTDFGGISVSEFVFLNEPELRIAEEIVRAEFATQIASGKGAWYSWGSAIDPTQLPEVGRGQHLMSSDKSSAVYEWPTGKSDPYDSVYRELEEEGRQDRELHENSDPNQYLRGKRFVGPQPVSSRYEAALEQALSALQLLAEIGPSDDIKGCSQMSAGDLREFAEEYKAGRARKFSSWGITAGQWGSRSEDSDQVHDILDAYRRSGEGTDGSFDDPVPQDAVPSLLAVLDRDPEQDNDDTYLGVIVFLVTHSAEVPTLYRERAKQIAEAEAADEAYLNGWNNPAERKTELEHEIQILGGSKTASCVRAYISKQKGAGEILRNGKTAYYAYINGAREESEDRGILNKKLALSNTAFQAYRRKKLLAWIEELGLDLSEELAAFDSGDFSAADHAYESVREMIQEDRKEQTSYRRTMRGPRPYNRKDKSGSFDKQALDPTFATFIGTFVTSMLAKWLGDQYSKRWGNLAQAATAKTEETLQQKGVFDLGTLDKYAQENGKNRMSAMVSLAGRSLALATVMTTGIAAQKLFSGEGKAQAAPPQQTEQVQAPEAPVTPSSQETQSVAPVEQAPDVYIGGPKDTYTQQQKNNFDKKYEEQAHPPVVDSQTPVVPDRSMNVT